MSVLRPDLMMKCSVPVVMAGIIAVSYALPECQRSDLHILRFTVLSCLSSLLVTVRGIKMCSLVYWLIMYLTTVGSSMSLAQGFTQLGAGLAVGLAGLAAGFAVGIVGDAGVRGTAQQPRLFVGMVGTVSLRCLQTYSYTPFQILMLIFAEVLGLYGV